MWEAEGIRGAAGAEESGLSGEAAGVEDALDETEGADEGGADEKGGEEVGFEGFGRAEEGEEINNSENCEKEEPDDAGGQDGADGVHGPKNRDGGVEGEK